MSSRQQYKEYNIQLKKEISNLKFENKIIRKQNMVLSNKTNTKEIKTIVRVFDWLHPYVFAIFLFGIVLGLGLTTLITIV